MPGRSPRCRSLRSLSSYTGTFLYLSGGDHGRNEYVLRFFLQRWFFVGLVLALVVGGSRPEAFQPLVAARPLRQGVVAAVMLLMALSLDLRTVVRVLRRPLAPLLGSAVNLGLVPLCAWAVAVWLPRSLGLGLLVAAATPCTLASASVWTRRAGGNDATAMLVTLLTNASCFLITPLWLAVLAGQKLGLESLQPARLMTDLGLLIVLPMIVAQLLRLAFRPVARWATARKTPLAIAAQCGVLYMIFLGSVQTGLTMAQLGPSARAADQFLLAIPASLLVHLVALALGMGLARLLGLQRADEIAVGFAGSQKTLMVGLQVSLELGVTILPMVAYHVGQLLVDTLIADRLRGRGEASIALGGRDGDD